MNNNMATPALKRQSMAPVYAAIFVALVLWTLMFSPITASHVNLWLMMTIAAIVLCICASVFGDWYKNFRISVLDMAIGITTAVMLWGVFWLGDIVSQWMFNFARPEVNAIYNLKGNISPWLLSILLVFLIGPAEEIFWRGFVQKRLSAMMGPTSGYIVATLVYSLVHAGSCNFMLVMAAMVAGGFWGMIYRFMPQRLGALIVSHALWDAAVFVWFPL